MKYEEKNEQNSLRVKVKETEREEKPKNFTIDKIQQIKNQQQQKMSLRYTHTQKYCVALYHVSECKYGWMDWWTLDF